MSGPVGRGLNQLDADTFDPLAAIGGWRGMVESVLPGFVFVALFIITSNLSAAIIASLAVAAVATIVRLLQRTPVTQAVGGLLGIGVGAIWAWRSGEASNFFAWGLITNAAFLIAVLTSIAVRWPLVGLAAETIRQRGTTWRADLQVRRRYTTASWLWAAAFALRLAVQVPLFLNSATAWLGTARLVMGLPLWALVLWITWVLVNPRAMPEAAQSQPDQPTTR